MPRRVFFSFHYDRDAQRASVVRNHRVTKDVEDAGYIDKAEWEKLERNGAAAIKKWIDSQLLGTSVTAVLIGAETSTRLFVRYELQQSYAKGNGIFGIYLHNIKDWNQRTDSKDDTNFGVLGKNSWGNDVYFQDVAVTYDWVHEDGYNNFPAWVDAAAKRVGK